MAVASGSRTIRSQTFWPQSLSSRPQWATLPLRETMRGISFLMSLQIITKGEFSPSPIQGKPWADFVYISDCALIFRIIIGKNYFKWGFLKVKDQKKEKPSQNSSTIRANFSCNLCQDLRIFYCFKKITSLSFRNKSIFPFHMQCG